MPKTPGYFQQSGTHNASLCEVAWMKSQAHYHQTIKVQKKGLTTELVICMQSELALGLAVFHCQEKIITLSVRGFTLNLDNVRHLISFCKDC